jgi:hypothetical protein
MCNKYITRLDQMDNHNNHKQKKALSREIDAGIVACALGQGCDEAELVRLSIEYATQFRCPYQFAAMHMRSLETDAERATARQLEVNVNNVIRTTMRSIVPGLTGLSRIVMEKFTDQPKPFPRPLVRRCNCTASRRSRKCNVPVEFCKHTAFNFAKVVPRQTKSLGSHRPKPKAASPKPKAASPKPKAASPKPKAASPKPKAASPKPKAASPKPKAASPKTRKSYGGRKYGAA